LLDHVTIRVSDRAESDLFYETVLATVGIEQSGRSDHYTIWGRQFSLAHADGDHAVTRGLHVGFAAPSREHIDEFWRAGTAAGYEDDGEPGVRPQYSEDYYGAFLRDPDGNSAEAVHHGNTAGRVIDHLWIRVADLGAARNFYERVAPFGGFRVNSVLPDRVQFAGSEGTVSCVAGEPTTNVHLAFEADDDATVDAFHRTLTDAGFRDNGAPGERAIYHPGYYSAFVLDPDGNNVEVVNHNR
jgi:catechol 2,3-dioxygenase-like lactoylglutathione lyase family enzyme